jgi:hypothetical protein
MTTVVLASSFLSGSLLTMLVPIATFVVVAIWGVLVIRRHERHREHLQTAGRPATGADADVADGSRSPGAG